MFYKLMAKLLEYPEEDLLTAIPTIKPDLQTLPELECTVIGEFLKGLTAQELTETQANYVQAFDMTPEHALHLTHHIFGDDKNRGPALIDLTEYYKQYGLELAANDDSSNELPDYLPLVLEFAAQLEPEAAHIFLSQWNKVLNQLASNLEKTDSTYAPLLRLVAQRSSLVQPQEAIA
ncbi:MAG: nitrate reductase molybdenum cofactor assembly chaperone [Thiohalomonadaceae bacterium]